MAALIRRWAAVTVLALAAGCTSGPFQTPQESTVTETPAPASVYLQQARDLITGVVTAVYPAAKVSTGVYSDDPPTACDPPLQKLMSYGIYRQFNAPVGHTGASLLPALEHEFKARGYLLDQVGELTAGQPSFAGQDQWIDFRVIGFKDSPLVKILMDTRCGTPEGIYAPSSSSSMEQDSPFSSS